MTQPSAPRPVTGPPRPGPAGPPAAAARPTAADPAAPAPEEGAAVRWADLPDRPVAEHVAAFEAEHARLQGRLGTIDRL